MVDIEGDYRGSKMIHDTLCSESSDSGIMSDASCSSDAGSVEEEEDYYRRLQDAMR